MSGLKIFIFLARTDFCFDEFEIARFRFAKLLSYILQIICNLEFVMMYDLYFLFLNVIVNRLFQLVPNPFESHQYNRTTTAYRYVVPRRHSAYATLAGILLLQSTLTTSQDKTLKPNTNTRGAQEKTFLRFRKRY